MPLSHFFNLSHSHSLPSHTSLTFHTPLTTISHFFNLSHSPHSHLTLLQPFTLPLTPISHLTLVQPFTPLLNPQIFHLLFLTFFNNTKHHNITRHHQIPGETNEVRHGTKGFTVLDDKYFIPFFRKRYCNCYRTYLIFLLPKF